MPLGPGRIRGILDLERPDLARMNGHTFAAIAIEPYDKDVAVLWVAVNFEGAFELNISRQVFSRARANENSCNDPDKHSYVTR